MMAWSTETSIRAELWYDLCPGLLKSSRYSLIAPASRSGPAVLPLVRTPIGKALASHLQFGGTLGFGLPCGDSISARLVHTAFNALPILFANDELLKLASYCSGK